ncbi:MAG TPA: CapA family protein [Dehalococcoidia bacterium]|nr:CapA family protein [Dehalococcoidia bacterium]
MIYEAALGNLTVIATGDSIINQPLSVYKEQAFTDLVGMIRTGDVGFTNLETLIHEFEVNPSVGSGGNTFMASHPRMLEELRWAGINLLSSANNHAYDYGEGGLLATIKNLEASGLAYSGTGRNLSEARAPRYLDTGRGRVALISVSSTFPADARAMEQRPDLQGHPGINALRFDTTYTVDQSAFGELRRAGRELGLDAERAWQAGFGMRGTLTPDTDISYHFLDKQFALGDGFCVATAPNTRDLEGNLKWVREARRQADWVLVSAHCHEYGAQREDPPGFLVAFARACIDAGADMFIGHGPHFVKGVEVYQGKPILYSIGNFILQNEQLLRLPAEFYDRFGLGPDATPGEGFDARSANGTRGFPSDSVWWESVVVACEYRGGQLDALRLHPIDLGHKQPRSRRGRPVLAATELAQTVLERMQRLSKPFGTAITIKDGVGLVQL